MDWYSAVSVEWWKFVRGISMVFVHYDNHYELYLNNLIVILYVFKKQKLLVSYINRYKLKFIWHIGQALAEEYARIDGYHTFYSWSRLRQGYSGVAIFCKTSLTPIRAEEG